MADTHEKIDTGTPITPYIGTITYFAFGYQPKGWLPCNGQLVSPSQYGDLFKLIRTIYGGNGTTTFGIPDLRGRTMISRGVSGMGMPEGKEAALLTADNLPIHNHTVTTAPKIPVNQDTTKANADDPTNKYFAIPTNNAKVFGNSEQTGATSGPLGVSVENPTQGPLPFSTISPYIAIQAYIAWQGIYPGKS